MVEEGERRMRLEDFLFQRFAGLSRMYLREAVRTEKCEVNGRNENVGHRLRPNDFVEIELDPRRANAMQPENVPLKIVFEDDDLLVVDKPAGMLAHPTHRDKSGTLLNALSFHLNRHGGRVTRPGLVHRLDKETSGLILVAKTEKSHRVLCAHFRRKRVKKRYVALVSGTVNPDQGLIEAPIGRYEDERFWGLKDDGKPSVTKFRTCERYRNDLTLLELEPVTGRTNQLRIHCAAIGHPIIGDTARGGAQFPRLCLHAYGLGLHHPSSGEWTEFETAIPPEITIREKPETTRQPAVSSIQFQRVFMD